MKKTLLIGIKDVRVAIRDRAAIILMLMAPFLLTLGLGFVSGRFSGGSTYGIGEIAIAVHNQDGGELSAALVELFQGADLADLITATSAEDLQAALTLIDEDQLAAVISIPAGFTDSIISLAGAETGNAVKVEIFTNPTRQVSAGVVQTIVEAFISQVETGRVSGYVIVGQLLRSGLISPQEAESIGREAGSRQASLTADKSAIQLETKSVGDEPVEFDVLAYMAPGMALMFLMFTVTYGGRSILAERSGGTLPRLLVTPTTTAQVLGGKVLGIYLTGVMQMMVLILASTLLFQLKWGDPLGVIVLVLAAVFGATGWGMLLTAVARTPNQVASVGSALMLTFGILGGSFVSLNALPPYIQWISKITPNAWGLDGFTALALGDKLPDIWEPVLALLVMGGVLFAVAVLLFNRQKIIEG